MSKPAKVRQLFPSRQGKGQSKPNKPFCFQLGRIRVDLIRLALLAFTVYFVVTFVHQQQQIDQLQVQLSDVHQKVVNTQEENQQARSRIQNLQTPGAMRQLARKNLGLVGPGEQPYTIEQAPGQQQSSSQR